MQSAVVAKLEAGAGGPRSVWEGWFGRYSAIGKCLIVLTPIAPSEPTRLEKLGSLVF